MGGFNYYREWQENLGDSNMEDSCILGFPRYDYTEVAAKYTIIEADQSSEKPAVNITRRKQRPLKEVVNV